MVDALSHYLPGPIMPIQPSPSGRTTLSLLAAIAKTHEEFGFRYPPYEFEWRKRPFDIIVGRKMVRENLTTLDWFEETARDLASFEEEIAPFKLY